MFEGSHDARGVALLSRVLAENAVRA